MKPTKIAVISDLHIGRKARAKDFCPYDEKEARDTDYKGKFLRFIDAHSIRADYLVIPGDISDRGQPDEFKLASALIKEIARGLHVGPKRIVFVPGNHDVDWEESSIPDSSGFRHRMRYAPLRDPGLIFERLVGSKRPHFYEPPHFRIWEFEHLMAVGYNSAWSDDRSVSVHHGLMSNDHVRKLDERLAGLDLSPNRLRLFIVHHHPIQYSDPIADEPDFSAMTNSENLLAVLGKHNFDLLIHGHKHSPRFKTVSFGSGFPLAILCAGSFSARLDTRWSGLVNNQFHLVTVEGRDPSSHCVFGLVESWTYLCGSDWVPSELYNGIRHKELFGTYVQPHMVKETLRPVIEQRLREKGYAEWPKLISGTPGLGYLRYLPPNLVMDVLDSLSGELDFLSHGKPPDDLILISRGD